MGAVEEVSSKRGFRDEVEPKSNKGIRPKLHPQTAH